jgi:hypothetical protein
VAIFGQPFLPNLKSSDYYLPIFNDGSLTPREMFKDFGNHSMAVVVALKKLAEIVVPLFPSPEIAKDFSKRNMKNKFHATSTLSNNFVSYCQNNNITFRFWDFPRKIDPKYGFELDCLTLLHDNQVEFMNGYTNLH